MINPDNLFDSVVFSTSLLLWLVVIGLFVNSYRIQRDKISLLGFIFGIIMEFLTLAGHSSSENVSLAPAVVRLFSLAIVFLAPYLVYIWITINDTKDNSQ